MRYSPFGRLGLSVSELSFGSWGLDKRQWADLDLMEAQAALALALERGVNLIDTAAAYGDAEMLIGETLRREQRSTEVHVCTKVTPLVSLELPSPHVHANEAFPGWHIRQSTEASLRQLGVERIAIQHLHAWSPVWLDEGDWLETLMALRDEGKIAGIGISLFDHDPCSALEIVQRGVIDCVQLMYNLFDQGAATELLPLCRQHGVAVIVRSPLYAGALTANITVNEPFASGDWRRQYFYDQHLAETRARVDALARQVRNPDHSIQDLALRFCLSHPAVSTVAIGMRQRRHVYANLRVTHTPYLNREELAQLAAHAWLC